MSMLNWFFVCFLLFKRHKSPPPPVLFLKFVSRHTSGTMKATLSRLPILKSPFSKGAPIWFPFSSFLSPSPLAFWFPFPCGSQNTPPPAPDFARPGLGGAGGGVLGHAVRLQLLRARGGRGAGRLLGAEGGRRGGSRERGPRGRGGWSVCYSHGRGSKPVWDPILGLNYRIPRLF